MENKITELILYIASRCKDDPAFGAIKLNKILFTVDFFYYGYTGNSVTDITYVHREKGPAPQSMHRIIESLIDSNRATMDEHLYFGYRQKRIIPKVVPNMSIFSEDELSFVDKIIEQFTPYNATQLSEWTHKLNPWLLTGEGEEIPYSSIFTLHDYPVGKDGILWANEELEKLRRDENYNQ